MKISVTNAQLLVHTLQTGIDTAMANGDHEFEFTVALQADDDAARQELVNAIAAAQKKPEGEPQTVAAADVGSVESVLGADKG